MKGSTMGITRIKSDKIILSDRLFSGYVYFENGRISAVTEKDLPFDIEYDKTDLYVSAGFIDMHTHGGAGFEFFGSFGDIVRGCNFHLRHGTTAICPTVSAAPFDVMRQSVLEMKKAQNNPNLQTNLVGAHLEGPYLSAAQCGGQCADFITPPNPEQYESLIKEAGNSIVRWTFAPEVDADGAFCSYITERGIVASAGHSDAVYDDMLRAVKGGCNLITHLYSCTSTVTRKQGFRQLGVIETAFLSDDIYVEIIADGKHLPVELIKLILKIKGTDKVALVTDSLALAGTDITAGKTLGTEFIIEDGVCKLADRSAFAGSIATADLLVRTMVKSVGVSIIDAVKMITQVPAKILKLNKGSLAVGLDADIVIFDEDINIKNVFVNGGNVI